MTRPRKRPNMTEKLASALLHIRKGTGDDWLVKGDLRNASAKEIVAACDFDHLRRWAQGGSNAPQNLQPLIRADHREKSKRDNSEIAKGKRLEAKEQAHRDRLSGLSPEIGDRDGDITRVTYAEMRAAGRPIQSRGFATKEERRAALERKERSNGR